MENIKKPKTFEEALILQEILDGKVGKPRPNGFLPRERNWTDMKLSLLDEFMEWLKELPQEINFKTWKQKTYNREKELEEYVDCLFFFLQIINSTISELEKYKNESKDYNVEKEIIFFKGLSLKSDFDFKKYSQKEIESKLEEKIQWFNKYLFWYDSISDAYFTWLDISALRGFTKQEILDTYWNKWKKNMERINKDWSLK